jgi:hypothetical protein
VVSQAPVDEAPVVTESPVIVASVVNEIPAAAAIAPASAHVDAGRYASQLISEINRYKQPETTAPAAEPGFQDRLAGEIQGSADVLAGLAPPPETTALGVFDEALGKMLGNDGPAATHPLLVVKT